MQLYLVIQFRVDYFFLFIMFSILKIWEMGMDQCIDKMRNINYGDDFVRKLIRELKVLE